MVEAKTVILELAEIANNLQNNCRCLKEINADLLAALEAAESELDRMEAATGHLIKLANAEGNPILSAWLPGAKAAIAKAKGD